MFGKRVFLGCLAVVLALFLQITSSEAQKQLGKAWQDDQYPRVRTYPNHATSGPNYAADFYFTERNHADLYMNGELPLADGLAGIQVFTTHNGSGYILLYDLTGVNGGNFPLIDAQRVIAGLNPIPRQSFSFEDLEGRTRKIDMEFVIDASTWRTIYVHLQIEDTYFNLPSVEEAVRQAISDFWNNIAPNCGGLYQRVVINLQMEVLEGTLLGTTNKWGLASDEHLHLQVFDGASFPPCLGTPVNLANPSEVTLAGQTILDSTLVVGVPGCDGGTCFYYPAMERQEFLPNQALEISAAWDGSTYANLRESPGGQVITTLPNGTQGILLSGPSVAVLPDGTYHVWWQCEFEVGTGWVAAEYLIHSNNPSPSPTEVLAWGLNTDGQVDTQPDSDFVTLSCGTAHNLALKSSKSIMAWGRNDDGQCNVPFPNTDFVATAGGAAHSMGLKINGSIVAWGWNDEYGQCDVPLPNSNFVAIAGGGAHSLGLKSDGSIVAWGANNYGQCDVPGPNTNFVAVAAGNLHSLGLKADGTIVTWGSNIYGQCDVPDPNADFVAVTAGMGEHSLGLKNDGTVVAWGWNEDGQCNPPTDTDFVAIAAGQFHSLGLKVDGSILGWGAERYNYGQCNVPEPNIGFVVIAAGAVHSIGLRLRSVTSDVSNEINETPKRLVLTIEPNPTTDIVRARFFLPISSRIQFNFYDVSGRLLPLSIIHNFGAGMHTQVFPNQNLANGMYFCIMRTGNDSARHGFIVLK